MNSSGASVPTITVTNATSIVNGDTSSISALATSDGGDGVSLAEAIMAADNSAGPTTIVLSSSLAGRSIATSANGLPTVTADGITITGPVKADGSPAVTIQQGAAAAPILLFVSASNFTLSHVAFANLGGAATALVIQPSDSGGAAHAISNINILNDAFSNSGTSSNSSSNAVMLNISDSASGASLSQVTISGSEFSGFTGNDDGILVSPRGSSNVVSAITIANNSFSHVTYGVELASSSSTASTIQDVSIVGNSFSNSDQAVVLDQIGNPGVTTASLTTGTVIAGNLISGSASAGIGILGGQDASNNRILATLIVNNLLTGNHQGISITGGASNATGNLVSGVAIVNDTIVGSNGPGVNINQNIGSSGNAVSGVQVSNVIFSGNLADVNPFGGATVDHSLVAQGPYSGTNGNLTATPRFVSASGGDYHLAAGSPGIAAGDSAEAPLTDLSGLSRFAGTGPQSAVDIGAYAFGAGPPPSALPAFLLTGIEAVLRAIPGEAAFDTPVAPISARLLSGAATVSEAIGEVLLAAENTSSVATIAYQFFTGATPSAAGMDYLVSPTGPNPNNLNSAYYQSFSVMNRYINFASNLGRPGGAGGAAFQADYGALSVSDALAKAYTAVFGTAPSADKVNHLLNDPVPDGLGGTYARLNYFESYGGDGANGLGTKAAMVGWLLAEGVVSDVGDYALCNDAYLKAIVEGTGSFSVNMIGLYDQTSFHVTGG